MEVLKVREIIQEFAMKIFKTPPQITGIKKLDEGWEVTIEVLEEEDYARRYAKDELVGIYNIQLDSDLQLLVYERKGFRERGTSKLH